MKRSKMATEFSCPKFAKMWRGFRPFVFGASASIWDSVSYDKVKESFINDVTYKWVTLFDLLFSFSIFCSEINYHLSPYVYHKTIQYFPIPLFCVVNLWTNLKNIHKSYEIFYNLIFFILLKIYDERTFLLFQDNLKKLTRTLATAMCPSLTARWSALFPLESTAE